MNVDIHNSPFPIPHSPFPILVTSIRTPVFFFFCLFVSFLCLDKEKSHAEIFLLDAVLSRAAAMWSVKSWLGLVAPDTNVSTALLISLFSLDISDYRVYSPFKTERSKEKHSTSDRNQVKKLSPSERQGWVNFLFRQQKTSQHLSVCVNVF